MEISERYPAKSTETAMLFYIALHSWSREPATAQQRVCYVSRNNVAIHWIVKSAKDSNV